MRPTPKIVFLLLASICAAQPPVEIAMLAAHNAVRARVGVPPLKWSDRLADQAQGWANRLLAENRFAHRPNPVYGENLFEIAGAQASPEQVVETWAAESRDYDYAANKCRELCGHYTQLVWAATKTVGCGVARNARREIWVCNYEPPGNYVGKRPY
jgi:pathogenesis-related protein 1